MKGEGDVRKGIADDADIFVGAGRGDPAIAANGLNDDAGGGAVEDRVAGDHQVARASRLEPPPFRRHEDADDPAVGASF